MQVQVSVAMCTLNGGKFIERQINSIINQTVHVDELIVCDDGSSDNTLEILKLYQNTKTINIKIYRNKVTIGFHKNYYKACSLTTGEIIFFSDQDDEWFPNKVEVTLKEFEKTNCLGLFSDGFLVDEASNDLRSTLFRSSCFDLYIEKGIQKDELFTALVLGNNYVTGAAFAIRRAALRDFSNSTIAHDYYLAIQLSSINKLSYINEKLINYRIHNNQTAGLKLTPKDYYLNNYNLYYNGISDKSLYNHYIHRRRFFYRITKEKMVNQNCTGVISYETKLNALMEGGWGSNKTFLLSYFVGLIKDKIYQHIWLPISLIRKNTNI